MRLFVAAEIDDAVRREAAVVADRVAREVSVVAGPRAVAWVKPQNLHFTVKFLGEVPASALGRLRACLAEPMRTGAFSLTVSGLGVYPASGPSRVIWLGLTEGAPGLGAVHDELDRRLAAVGYEPERRPFSSHLTLGRVKTPIGPAGRQALARVPVGVVGSCRVAQITLFESCLSSAGPTYTAIERYQLGDQGP
jgi:RNA 2',3'-cyclic 3'-phosphodiesterase